MSLIYTGIGSRQTPDSILNTMYRIGQIQAARGYILRSGHADGADIAFEKGCIEGNGAKEIFLPWKMFNYNRHPPFGNGYHCGYTYEKEAMEIASRFHPAWNRCSDGAKKMHTRNVYQILGLNLETPTNGVVCWTPNGSGSGGTGQAIRIAKAYEIPVFDLGDFNTLQKIESHYCLRK